MDKLDRLIGEKQAELDRLKKEIDERAARHERVLIELATLKEAAAARPVPSSATNANSRPIRRVRIRLEGRKGGRSAGDISHEWRKVLRIAQELHRRLTYADIHELAGRVGIKTKMPNVRERVRTMAENGLLTGTSEKGFLVTAEAVSRFGLDKPQAA